MLPAGAQATVKALNERNVRVRVLTNSLASNDMLPAHSGYAKTRRRLLENGMELYELRPDTDAFRPGWSLRSGQSQAALHTKAMVFDGEAVFIGSFNLDPRSAVINTEAGFYIESAALADRLTDYMATGVVPANSYRVRLDAQGGSVWESSDPTCPARQAGRWSGRTASPDRSRKIPDPCRTPPRRCAPHRHLPRRE